MTRKDFEVIAKVMAKCSYGEGIIMANELERVYPAFDREKFLDRVNELQRAERCG